MKTPRKWVNAASVEDFESLAEAALPRPTFEFLAAAAGKGLTSEWNRLAFDHVILNPRILHGVTSCDLHCDLLGRRMQLPILIAPTAFHRVFHPQGERETARGAHLAGVTFIISNLTSFTLREISQAAPGSFWFQLYDFKQKERGSVINIINEAEALGIDALCLTVDAPSIAAHQGLRQHLVLPKRLPYVAKWAELRKRNAFPSFGSMTWTDVEFIRARTKLPIVLKGILNEDDIEAAVSSGADAIVVSNHGGRTLDTVPPALEMLPLIVERVRGRLPVLMDGGVRRGADVLKAIALGARAVLIGRSYLYALAAGGASGIERITRILARELETALAHVGCRSLSEVNPAIIRRHEDPFRATWLYQPPGSSGGSSCQLQPPLTSTRKKIDTKT